MPTKRASNNPNGRPAGTPNKATMMAREAIGVFVEGNADKLIEWLDLIAKGIKDEKDQDKFLVAPNPEGAFKAYMSVVEYHIPKLNRTEHQALDKSGKPSDGFTVGIVKL